LASVEPVPVEYMQAQLEKVKERQTRKLLAMETGKVSVAIVSIIRQKSKAKL
jgi:hypothetical protein